MAKRTSRRRKGGRRFPIRQNRPNFRKEVIGRTETFKVKTSKKTIFRRSKKIKGKEYEDVKNEKKIN